ncbi:MAG: DNA-directed RNA polymerase subunit H [archaeon]
MKKSPQLIDHELIPKHVKLSEKEKKELLQKYSITIKHLPQILKGDSAIQMLDAKPGDVIKICRQSPTVGEAIFYRGVVDE